MTVESTTPELELRDLLDQWAAGIADRRPDDVAALFTEDALFQGFDPAPGFGRDYIAGYYARQPVGLTADYELLSVREVAPGVLAAYARVLFGRADGDVAVHLTVVAQPRDSGLSLSHYHVSRLVEG